MFAYWSLPQIFFLGLYTLLGEVLNARKSFGPFTWAPVVNNVVAIAMLVIFIVAFGADPYGHRSPVWTPTMVALLAGGATLGVAVQALILFFFWKRIGLRFRFDFRWRGVNLGHAGQAAGWTFGMLLATQVGGPRRDERRQLGRHGIRRSAGDEQRLADLHAPARHHRRLDRHRLLHPDGGARARGRHRCRSAPTSRAPPARSCCSSRSRPPPSSWSRSRWRASSLPTYQALGFVLIAYLIGLVPFSLVFMAQRAFYSLGDTRTPFYFTARAGRP